MHIDVPNGDVVDKITILQIKESRIGDGPKLENVKRELASLRASWEASGIPWPEDEATALLAINEVLWDVEDELRRHEARGDFGPEFVERARAVYRTNDQRARVKRAINDRTGSNLVEEKAYVAY